MWWPYLRLEIEAEFLGIERALREQAHYVLLERRDWHKARRRDLYDTHRQANDSVYRCAIARARINSFLRRREYGPELQRIKSAKAQAVRAQRIAGRTCPECGEPVTRNSGIGVTPKYCSTRCSRRVASRNWWRRNHGSKR